MIRKLTKFAPQNSNYKKLSFLCCVMTHRILIKKGLDITLLGKAERKTHDSPKSDLASVYTADFYGITPKLIVKKGQEVKVGSPLFHSKTQEEIKIVSPVSGEILEIVRGAKRRILEIKILPDRKFVHESFPRLNPNYSNKEDIKDLLLKSGCWSFIKQRPYDIIANHKDEPKAIYISGFDSQPNAPDLNYTLKGKEKEIEQAILGLQKLTSGKVHIGLRGDNSPLANIQDVDYIYVKGPHPSGNVGVQIHHTSPINKGEIVWIIRAQNLPIIGEMFLNGRFNSERIVAVTGSEIKNPQYVRTHIGASLKRIIQDNVKEGKNRIISGNVLTGKGKSIDGFLHFSDHQISVIPEGKEYKFMGWVLPDFSRFSILRAGFFTWLMPKKKYKLSANSNGEERPLVMTGNYEKVFPFDIYPQHLIKAIMVNDIDLMENLGIYEISPEDFALPEFICVSKTNIQELVRGGLDVIAEEMK